MISAGWRHLFIWLNCFVLSSEIETSYTIYASDLPVNQPSQILTNINQFREVFNENADVTCQFRLAGTVTMVDTNRNLFVLQDDVGAMAFSLNGKRISFQPGQLVIIEGDQASPYFESFPSYPYQPSGSDIKNSFEAPSNWGEYHLTRMRGFLHPPVTGEYTFWIASDNSSELWLSSNDSPTKAEKIAFIKSGDWVNQHEWFRYPSQRSETMNLSADKTYFIEAVSEQLLLDENLAVAWQPPGFRQSIIDGRYLTPWVENQEQIPLSQTNGILREYWTNYTFGSLAGIIEQKSFASMFVLKEARATVAGQGTWPEPKQIFLDQPLSPEDGYHWVKVQGTISFLGINGNSAILELAYKGGQAQVRVSDWQVNLPQRFQNRQVEIEGVCEGMQTANGYLMPGLIWTPSKEFISPIESTNLNNSVNMTSLNPFSEEMNDTNRVWSSFTSIRGVVTFNDRVFDRYFLFIQNDTVGVYVSQKSHQFSQLQIGQWVEIGGTLMSDGNTPSIDPAVVKVLGRRPIPQPMTQPVEIPTEASRNGQWTELEGVIHSINTNGTMVMMGKRGSVPVWIGQVSPKALTGYVDSTLRLRGVLSLVTDNDPVLLVPSRDFVETKEAAPEDPFGGLSCYTTEINDAAADNKWIHRVKIAGVVSYKNGRILFVQDDRGGVRIELLSNSSPVEIGDQVEVVGFPKNGSSSKTLTETLIHVVGSNAMLNPRKLNVAKANLTDYYDTLVRLAAKIVAQKSKGSDQILDLQEGQRFYEAVLASNFGRLPIFEPGSRLEITGVFDAEAFSDGEKSPEENDLSGPVKILLRGPQDVVVLRGAPWWTWKGFIFLAVILLTVIIIGSLVIYILRRRLERQRQAKFVFSRQILQSQEEERRRIAVNLHDALGQNLLFIKNQSHLATELPVGESAIRHLKEISDVTANILEEVRQITRNLRPYQLDRLGLTQAVLAIIKQVSENSSTVFASHVDKIDEIFDKEVEIHIYRIIQESLNNIVKHSGATEATIVIKRNAVTVLLSIRDNGQGFDMTLDRPVGFGLNSIMERVWILGGKSKIDTAPGCGANLIFEIPISRAQNEI